VTPANRSEARKSLKKADEMNSAAASELAVGRWNSAGLNAVHAGICAADAALIASAAVRSSSQDHGAVLALLEERVKGFAAAQRRQLGGLLKVKSLVAYEQRLLTEDEARQLVDHANRLTKWATGVVAEQLR
jgi:HEPN domain-containing protein